MALTSLPTNLSLSWESMICSDYIAGNIEVEELEHDLEALFARGVVPPRMVGGLPSAADGMRLERELR